MKPMFAVLAASMVLGLTACGGGGGGGVPGSSVSSAGQSCSNAFDPDKLDSGQDCTSKAGTYCDGGQGLEVLQSDPIPCDGVIVESHSISAAGLSSDYLTLGSESGRYEAILLSLHYLQARTGVHVNVTRQSEIAKARRALVVVPQAPSVLQSVVGGVVDSLIDLPESGSPTNLLSRWPTGPLEPVDDVVDFLKAVVARVREQYNLPNAPVYVSGISNGAVMAYNLACRAAGDFDAILAVASDLSQGQFENCAPSRPIGTVIVHGTGDVVTAYRGVPLLSAAIPEIHAFFKQANGCSGEDTVASMPTQPDDPLLVNIHSSGPCNAGRRSFLVEVEGGGHNWPGGADNGSVLETIGLLGAHTNNFDASVQGYDLLRLAAGN